MQRERQRKEYDTALKSKAFTGFALRVLVAGYMVYLAWKLMSNMLGGSGSIPAWGVYVICVVFTAAAAGFCIYSWKAFRKALKAAEIIAIPDTISEEERKTDIPEEDKDDH